LFDEALIRIGGWAAKSVLEVSCPNPLAVGLKGKQAAQ
jgi:hypothetical protein